MYKPYKTIQKDAMVDLEDKIDECIAYRANNFENLFAGEVPNEYPVPEEYPSVGSPEEEVYRGLCGEHYLKPVVIEGRSLDDDVYYIGCALKEGNNFIPWMDGTLKNSSDVTIATGETPEKLLANYLTASGTLQDGAIVSIQSASSDNYLDGRSPGKTGVKVNLTNRSPIGNKFLQWKLISFGDKWAFRVPLVTTTWMEGVLVRQESRSISPIVVLLETSSCSGSSSPLETNGLYKACLVATTWMEGVLVQQESRSISPIVLPMKTSSCSGISLLMAIPTPLRVSPVATS